MLRAPRGRRRRGDGDGRGCAGGVRAAARQSAGRTEGTLAPGGSGRRGHALDLLEESLEHDRLDPSRARGAVLLAEGLQRDDGLGHGLVASRRADVAEERLHHRPRRLLVAGVAHGEHEVVADEPAGRRPLRPLELAGSARPSAGSRPRARRPEVHVGQPWMPSSTSRQRAPEARAARSAAAPASRCGAAAPCLTQRVAGTRRPGCRPSEVSRSEEQRVALDAVEERGGRGAARIDDLGGQAVLGEDRRGRAVGRAGCPGSARRSPALRMVVDHDVAETATALPEHVGLHVEQGHALEPREVRRAGSCAGRSRAARAWRRFSGRVTPPKVTIGAVARLRPQQLAQGQGAGDAVRDRDRAAGRGRRSPPSPSTSRTACTRSRVRSRAISASSRSPTMSAHETLRRFSRTRWSSSPLVVVTRTLTSGRGRRERVHRLRRALRVLEADDRDRVPARAPPR